MVNEMLRIRKVKALDDYRVQVTLTNGDVVERDLTDLIWGPVFEPLRADYNNFRAVYVEEGTLAWPDDLDFDPDVLIWNGAPPDDPAARPQPFLRVASQRQLASAGA